MSVELHDDLLFMLASMRVAGAKINPTIVKGVATGLLIGKGQSHLLSKYGGSIDLTSSWARDILRYHLGWVKQKVTTSRSMTDSEKIEACSAAIALEKQMEMYHPALVFEFDETLAAYCPMDDFTYAPEVWT